MLHKLHGVQLITQMHIVLNSSIMNSYTNNIDIMTIIMYSTHANHAAC